MINPTKHTLPCQYLIKLGVIEYAKSIIPNAKDLIFNRHERDESRAWFEGFVIGLHEASVIDDKTCDELIDKISKIGRVFNVTIETPDNEHATQLLDETE